LASSSTLKMRATCSSETSIDFQHATRRYIPEDGAFHKHRCENLRPYIKINVFPLTVFLQRRINREKNQHLGFSSMGDMFIVVIIIIYY
jgi:hypothetical protein